MAFFDHCVMQFLYCVWLLLLYVSVYLVNRMTTSLENPEYSGNSLSLENLGNYQGIFSNLREKLQFFVQKCSKVRSQPDPTEGATGVPADYPRLLQLLLVVIPYQKVNLLLWKNVENLGIFFILLCGYPG